MVLRLAEQSGRQQPAGMFVPILVTREQLANLAGTTRETFTRMLGEYKRLGLLKVVHGGLLIPDMERLRAQLQRE